MALRQGTDRMATAKRIARTRIELMRPLPPRLDDRQLARIGAAFVAGLLRSLRPSERSSIARVLSPELLRAAANVASRAPILEGRSCARFLTVATVRLGRVPNAVELGQLVHAAAGFDHESAPPVVHATLRSARSLGLVLAEVFAVFGPSAQSGSE
jgi:hypothetical protein